jgi:hypothetical protein
LRLQALEPVTEGAPNPKNADIAFLERCGLVAWVEGAPQCAALAEIGLVEQKKAESSHSELVMVLVALVIGDRKE